MRAISLWVLLSMVWIAPRLAAQERGVDCKSARFSDAVLERFPRVREACLDVISVNDTYYAVFKAKLLGVSHGAVRIQPRLPDGTFADARRVEVSENRRVLVEGRPVTFGELTLGQVLVVYIQVREPLVVFPPADTSESWTPAPLLN